jgi:hypothetical protein
MHRIGMKRGEILSRVKFALVKPLLEEEKKTYQLTRIARYISDSLTITFGFVLFEDCQLSRDNCLADRTEVLSVFNFV